MFYLKNVKTLPDNKLEIELNNNAPRANLCTKLRSLEFVLDVCYGPYPRCTIEVSPVHRIFNGPQISKILDVVDLELGEENTLLEEEKELHEKQKNILKAVLQSREKKL